jgi:hypothetical protein
VSNQLTGSPFVIDTPGPGVLIPGDLDVYRIRWISPSANAGHAAIIQDRFGREIWASVAAGVNHVEVHPLALRQRGLIVPTLSSGKLYIYTRT